MGSINGGGFFGWLQSLKGNSNKVHIGDVENDLEQSVSKTAKTKIKASPSNTPKSASLIGRNISPSSSSDKKMPALPLLPFPPSKSSSKSTERTQGSAEESASMAGSLSTEGTQGSTDESASIASSLSTESSVSEEVDPILFSYETPKILEDVLARTSTSSPQYAHVKELLKLQGTFEKELLKLEDTFQDSKNEMQKLLNECTEEYQNIREESSIIKDIIVENRSDRFFDTLQDNVISESSSQKESLIEKRDKLMETCENSKKKISESKQDIKNKIEEVEKKTPTAFNTIYLEHLKTQKSFLQSLDSITRSLETRKERPISKDQVWSSLKKTLQELPKVDKELACRVVHSLNGDSATKEVLKGLLRGQERARPNDISTAALLTLIKDVRAAGYLKYHGEAR